MYIVKQDITFMDSKEAFDIVYNEKNFSCNNVAEPHTIDMFDTNTNTSVAFSCNHVPGSDCKYPQIAMRFLLICLKLVLHLLKSGACVMVL